MKNKYAHRSRISEARFREFVRLFAMDLTAEHIAFFARLNRNTVNRYMRLVRERMAEHCERVSPILGGGPEALDVLPPSESGPPVFGLLQRGGAIYTELVPAYAAPAVRALLRAGGAGALAAFSGYDCLVDLGAARPYHARPEEGADMAGNTPARDQSLSGSFWSFSKRRLGKFHGVPRHLFYLHLKECEFRFNLPVGAGPGSSNATNKAEACYRLLLRLLKKHPLN